MPDFPVCHNAATGHAYTYPRLPEKLSSPRPHQCPTEVTVICQATISGFPPSFCPPSRQPGPGANGEGAPAGGAGHEGAGGTAAAVRGAGAGRQVGVWAVRPRQRRPRGAVRPEGLPRAPPLAPCARPRGRRVVCGQDMQSFGHWLTPFPRGEWVTDSSFRFDPQKKTLP